MVYLIIANLMLAISFALYHMFFRKLTFFQWNRYYLLGTVLLSFLAPIGVFIDLSAWRGSVEVLPTVDIAEIVDLTVLHAAETSAKYTLTELLFNVYAGGIILTLAFFIYRVLRLRGLLQQPSDYQSFSFFSRIFLGQKVVKDEIVHAHEQVHVSQGHSYDVLLMELVIIFNWFNPIVYLVRKELKFQHECIADELCSEDKVAYAELLVAHALKVAPSALQHDFSNQSFLKKRITMLFKNKSKERHKLVYVASIPFLFVIGASTLIFNTSKAREIVSDVENQIQDVTLKVSPETVAQAHSSGGEFISTPENGLFDIAPLIAQEDTTKRSGRISQNGESRWHKDHTGQKLFESVEILPVPKGGMEAFRMWIANNFEYPKAAIDASAKGTIVVNYIVEADGRLTNFEILKDIGYGTGGAAVRMLEKAEPWNPGIQDGQTVRVKFTLPIRLDLTNM